MAGTKDNKHLALVRSRDCLVCERPSPSVAHHLRFAQEHGLGQKVDDSLTVPLCVRCHFSLHEQGNEKNWWDCKGIDPLQFIDKEKDIGTNQI